MATIRAKRVDAEIITTTYWYNSNSKPNITIMVHYHCPHCHAHVDDYYCIRKIKKRRCCCCKKTIIMKYKEIAR